MANGFFAVAMKTKLRYYTNFALRRALLSQKGIQRNHRSSQLVISIPLHKGCLSFNSSKPLAVARFAQNNRDRKSVV